MRKHVCPSHGEVLPLRGVCPWGCEYEFAPQPVKQVFIAPLSWDVQRATEATTLFHLTEPKEGVA